MIDTKRIIRFIGLKILEIGGIVFIPWGAGLLINQWPYWTKNTHAPIWIDGFMCLAAICIIVMFIVLITAFIKINWKWAEKE